MLDILDKKIYEETINKLKNNIRNNLGGIKYEFQRN